MVKTSKSKLAELRTRRERLQARMDDLCQAERRAQRRADTRRKILVGAAILTGAARDEDAFADLMRRLDEFLVHPRDRELFDLPNERPPPT